MRIADLDVLMPFEQQMFGPEAWSRQGYLDELADTELRYYIVAEGTADRDRRDDRRPRRPAARHRRPADHRRDRPDPHRRGAAAGPAPGHRPAAGPGAGRRGPPAPRQEVLLEVREDNEAAQRLYAGEGFTVLGRRRGYYEQGRVDAVTMRYPLQPAEPDVDAMSS